MVILLLCNGDKNGVYDHGGCHMILEDMKLKKKVYGYTNQQISERSGVPLATVQKIFSGETIHPRYQTLKALEKAFREENYGYPDVYDSSEQVMLGDSAFIDYGSHDRNHSIEDYRKLPEERRVELIEGAFYDMAAPSSLHQMIAGQVFAAFLSCIKEHGADCIPFIAPADVQLYCDDRTMVQPDVFIVCDRNKIHSSHIMGAPDLVVEILSEASRKKDMTLKLSQYLAAGVREYWIIDPRKRKVIIYLLGDDMDITLYGFDDRIPVAISDGLCFLDFSAISQYISFMYPQV